MRENGSYVGGINEVAHCLAGAPYHDLVVFATLGFVKTPDHGWDHMGLACPEIVVLTVHVARDDDHRIETILSAVAPAGHDAHLLGCGIASAFGLWKTVPHLFFIDGR